MRKPLVLALALAAASAFAQAPAPVRIAIVGLVHDHARGMIPRFTGRTDVQLVGIVEPDKALAESYAKEFHLPAELFYPTLDALAARQKVQAVALFTSTLDHRAAAEQCASLGLDVMMEKPMATTLADARAIADAAKRAGIRVVVNYETTWYPSLQAAYPLVCEQHAIGDIRKFVVHDGHEGPKAIGCSPAFLDWLTDPVKNGGGVTMDFGCYGADIATWMMGGQAPTSVVAVAQHLQPEAYPKVEDEATIVLLYPKAQAIIQASWNWPFDRKDVEIYGSTGSLMQPNRSTLLLRKGRGAEAAVALEPPKAPYNDPLSYLAAVQRREIEPSGPSSVAVNLVVCQILDAARQSAQTGRRVDLAP